ncbi:NAD(P)/FAD-dependent oxidoreductase [Conexibacter arvalis]|uniref:2-polyprenyl-6-methoxyphenol hydroxylase-like FAD-dependent oxidoreductase n=1 Tax=Conexibacter arvalis TaxID=912552 RepID=A0A840IE85_9ACTN|nr:NAD(P)/FAD-dependent oxidoreductase [Conexibacter arvalis]MBB4663116.1 2-polyprenyl-6-methoxyphenol hydroxylase-like FAD-dependent oxidoreductase [Conexibacter arvalis]
MAVDGQWRSAAPEYDAVVVGASLAGCTAAILLGRAGARVALVERQPDPAAFKRICTHLIQASGVPTLERLGLLEPALALGGVRSHLHVWTAWGWIAPPDDAGPRALNLRRERLDPLLRATALDTPGVEPLLGRTADALLRDERDGRIRGVVVRDRGGGAVPLRARLVIGADGCGSQIAELAGVETRVTAHGRFAYGAYFEGPAPERAPNASAWFLDPQWAAAFPTDDGLTFYAAMPTKERLPEFRRDPERALTAFVSNLPDAPPIRDSRRVGTMLGKLEMPNVRSEPIAPGLALVGDAAMAIDPLWGIGCGWALQSAEWLCDEVAAPLAAGPAEDGALARGLRAYRRRWRGRLMPHVRMIEPYASGRRNNRLERALYAAGARDARIAAAFESVGARTTSPLRGLGPLLPRIAAVNLRHARSGRERFAPYRSRGPDAAAAPGAGAGGGAEREAVHA